MTTISCAPPVRSTAPGPLTPDALSALWQEPADITSRDLMWGAGGQEHAPAPAATYTFLKKKTHGVSPGFTVTDPQGVEWSAKEGAEAEVEVVTSRIIWAVGYHQPPVYYLPHWTMTGAGRDELNQPEARMRPKLKHLKEKEPWSWQQNPFVGTREYGGLLTLMMILNESDLKNSNNSLYDLDDGEHRQTWYIVRDIGTALGETGRLDPKRNDIRLFERNAFILGVRDGYVQFEYRGLHQELLNRTVRPTDVRWICGWLSRLTPEQWRD
ncbi:MAG TPA: hypothetical protein VF921_12645, partial [Vicinamibacterales bacterium]